jgi:hypothetical protein
MTKNGMKYSIRFVKKSLAKNTNHTMMQARNQGHTGTLVIDLFLLLFTPRLLKEPSSHHRARRMNIQ